MPAVIFYSTDIIRRKRTCWNPAQEMGKEMLRFHRLYGEKISRRFRQLHIDRLSQTEYLLLAIIVERNICP